MVVKFDSVDPWLVVAVALWLDKFPRMYVQSVAMLVHLKLCIQKVRASVKRKAGFVFRINWHFVFVSYSFGLMLLFTLVHFFLREAVLFHFGVFSISVINEFSGFLARFKMTSLFLISLNLSDEALIGWLFLKCQWAPNQNLNHWTYQRHWLRLDFNNQV